MEDNDCSGGCNSHNLTDASKEHDNSRVHFLSHDKHDTVSE